MKPADGYALTTAPSQADAGALDGFERNARMLPDAPCIVTREGTTSYGQLRERARHLGALILRLQEGQRGFVGVFAQREPVLYEAVLGTMYAGSAYVPIGLKNPKKRVHAIAGLSEMRVCIVPRRRLARALDMLPASVMLIVPDADGTEDAEGCSHRIHKPESAAEAVLPDPPPVTGEDPAYLMFTSGTTGTPKGIVIRHGNLTHFLASVAALHPYSASDRCSQAFDATFDLSVHDMFVTWEAGASLYPVPDGDQIAPARFIQRNELTVWYSVPSVGLMMRRAGLLKENAFPTLRYCFFCGDALPVDLARDWIAAAPNARVVNYYGPTEATISISMQEVGRGQGLDGRPYVPIGRPYPGHTHILLGEGTDAVGTGELCIAGPQVFQGYLQDPDRTAASFHVGDDGSRYYRTGDLVEETEDGLLHFLGRVDHQVKIRGFRVELQEIELVAREAVKTDFAVALAFRSALGLNDDIALFHNSAEDEAEARILAAAREHLPEYMVPRKVRRIDTLPLTQNGKTDRTALRAMLEH